MADRFGLDNLREGVQKRSEELSKEAQPRSTDGSALDQRKPFTFEQEDYDRTEAPRDNMRTYWRQFETTPIIRKPITAFASRVTEPGYYIESEELDEEQIRELGNWLSDCAIIEGQPGKDFRLLAKKAMVQREVRGTALVEKAPHRNNNDKIAGLKLINPETMEAVTRPHQSILMAPDDIKKYEDVPETEEGDAAAWLQDILETDETLTFGRPVKNKYVSDTGDEKIGFRRDEIIPLTRDADVGEVFGTSRIEAVSDRIEGIKQKLSDNDEAIASKAYPLWLFMFGSEEEPWDSDDIKSFMKSHEMENFHPGMKQGVRGDVSVETISGEVADIADYLEFDIQWIMASMPMPMFVLGSFGRTLAGAQFQGMAQQQDVVRQIEEARRELEQEFTPMLRDVARQKGFDEDTVKSLRLRFGDPGAPNPEVRQSQQTIRYISDANDAQDPEPATGRRGTTVGGGPQIAQMPGQQPQPGAPAQDPTPNESSGGQESTQSDEQPSAEEAALWRDIWSANSYEELQDAMDISEERKQDLSADISQLFLNVRDRVLDSAESTYTEKPSFSVVEFEYVANRKLDRGVREQAIRQRSRELLKDVLRDITRSIEGANQQSPNSMFFSQSVENAVRDAAESMLRSMRVQIRKGAASDESWQHIRERIEEQFSDAELEERADLIAQMELKNAVETTKLQAFEQSDEIIGVRVSNPDASTPITQSLDGAEAYFDSRDDVRDQLADQADERAMREGFDPLPRVPPYHFGDTSTLEPIYQNNETN